MTTASDSVVDYSIVIPVYFNEGTLTETMSSIKDDVLARNPNLRCEVIFVDDGSGDGSLEELLRLYEEDPGIVKVIKLTRNFGQVNALLAGFSHAKGECAIAMSADGQDPAVLINDMLRAYFEEQCEIVVCARQGRDESWYRVLTSRLFYALVRKLSFPNMPAGGFDFVLLGRRALDVLLSSREAYPFLQGQILWTGFKTKFLKYHRLERKAGQSRWTFGKKITYLIDGVMSYSFLPIRLMSAMGILFALLGLLYAVIIFVLKVAGGIPIEGWAPLMIVVLIMGGIQMLMLGVIGEYQWRTLGEARRRPRYIIDEVFGEDAQEPAERDEGSTSDSV